MANFYKITNSDGKQIIVITDKELPQVQEYYTEKSIAVKIESYVPSEKEVLKAIPLE